MRARMRRKENTLCARALLILYSCGVDDAVSAPPSVEEAVPVLVPAVDDVSVGGVEVPELVS